MSKIFSIRTIEEHFLRNAKTRGEERLLSLHGLLNVLKELEELVYSCGEIDLKKIQHIENELLNNQKTEYKTSDLINQTNIFLYGKYRYQN